MTLGPGLRTVCRRNREDEPSLSQADHADQKPAASSGKAITSPASRSPGRTSSSTIRTIASVITGVITPETSDVRQMNHSPMRRASSRGERRPTASQASGTHYYADLSVYYAGLSVSAAGSASCSSRSELMPSLVSTLRICHSTAVPSQFRLTILPPGLPPQHPAPVGGRLRALDEVPGEQAKAEILRSTGTGPAACQPTTVLALSWDFTYEANSGPSPSLGSGLRTGRRKTRLTCGEVFTFGAELGRCRLAEGPPTG